MRRAASRARSAGSAAATWCRCPRSSRSPSSTPGACALRAGPRAPDHRARRDGRRGARSGAAAAALLARDRCRRRAHAARRCQGLVCVRQNRYSVPCALVGLRVTATIGRARSRSRAAARSPATSGSRPPRDRRAARSLPRPARAQAGALAGSVALAQDRERGAWPGLTSCGRDRRASRASRPPARWSRC